MRSRRKPGLFLLGALVVSSALVAVSARADDDLVLDLGGEKLETRHVVHGVFTQGVASAEPGHDRDEEPAHQVTISRDFWMGKYPVTKGQFAKFVSDTRYVSDAEKGPTGGAGWDGKALVQKKDFSWKHPGFTQTDEHPVVLVTYGDATAFVGWASRKTGKRVRLPTEAEWEYAARGGSTTPWYGASTDAEAGALGWFKSNAGNGTRPVGQKKANVLGLFDMSGNVFEWCRDVYGPYQDVAAVDPEVTVNTGFEGEKRVLRGGSWLRDVKRARSGARFRNAPGSRNADNGFRVVVTNDEAVGPGVTGPTTDFAPTSPLGATSGGSGPSPTATSGPLADGEPVRVDPVGHAGDAFSWGLLIISPLAAASAVVAWMLLRRKRPKAVAARTVHPARTAPVAPAAAAAQAGPYGSSTRASADGFFVRAPQASPGSRLRYECVVNGSPVTDMVPLAGDETFIYTGSAPTGIRILEILVAQQQPITYRAADRPPLSSPERAPLSSGSDLSPPSADELMPPSSRPEPPPPSLRDAPPPSPLPSSKRGPPPVPSSRRPAAIPPSPSSSPIPLAVPTPASSSPLPVSSPARASAAMPVAPRPLAVHATEREASSPLLVPLPPDSKTSSADATTQMPADTTSALADTTTPMAAMPSSEPAFLGHPRAY